MPPRQTISFSGGPLPPFLARMQAQVQGGSSASGSGSEERHFDPLLEARRKAKREEIEERRRKRAEGKGPKDGEDDEDDEFDGAQVVVLDEASDLSREQALRGPDSKQAAMGEPSSEMVSASGQSESIATPGTGTKRKAEDGLSGGTSTPKGLDALAEEVAKRKRVEQREKERKEKNKRAAKEKKKAGKGLSFDL